MRNPKVLELALLYTPSLLAQSQGAQGLSFDDAKTRLDQVSDILAGSRANLRSKTDLSSATRHLWWPELTLDAPQGARSCSDQPGGFVLIGCQAPRAR